MLRLAVIIYGFALVTAAGYAVAWGKSVTLPQPTTVLEGAQCKGASNYHTQLEKERERLWSQ